MSKAIRVIKLVKRTTRTLVTDLKKIVLDTEVTVDLERAEQVVGGVLVAIALVIGVMEHPFAKMASGALALIGGKLLHNGGSAASA